jgi:hypothetical protein
VLEAETAIPQSDLKTGQLKREWECAWNLAENDDDLDGKVHLARLSKSDLSFELKVLEADLIFLRRTLRRVLRIKTGVQPPPDWVQDVETACYGDTPALSAHQAGARFMISVLQQLRTAAPNQHIQCREEESFFGDASLKFMLVQVVDTIMPDATVGYRSVRTTTLHFATKHRG